MADESIRAGRRPDYVPPKSTMPIGKTYFLGIGIDAYRHWPRLKNAVSDVRAIADLLVADYGLQHENAYLLLNEEATEARIVDTLERFTQKVQAEDSVLIYYAGHGHLNERGRGFWVPVDAPKDQVVRYIRNSTIKDYIGDIPSLHTLLISDSCFSGSLFSSGATRSSDLAADELARLPSRWAICSGRHDEVVADGPGDGHSPFAESILEVLRHNERPVITTGFLVQQVIEQTRANYDQLPDGGPLQGVGHKRGQYVFRQQSGRGAALLWERIIPMAENTLPELVAKKQLLRQYCRQYPKGQQYNEALRLGRRLEQKRKYLEAYESEFGLLALLETDTLYRAEIEQRLQALRTQERRQGSVSKRPAFASAMMPAQEPPVPEVRAAIAKEAQVASEIPIPEGAKARFGRTLFGVFLLTAIPESWLIYNSNRNYAERVTHDGILIAMMLIPAILITYLIWRYGKRSLSNLRAWFLSLGAGVTFMIILAGFGDGRIGMVVFLGASLSASVLAIPAWVGIWRQKRKNRRLARSKVS